MIYKTVLNFALITILLTACGGGGNDSSSNGEDNNGNGNPQTTQYKFDGEYSVTVTPYTQSGNECGSASGSYTITEEKYIAGTITDTDGTVHTVTGERDTNGDVSGGFAFSDGSKSADFEGSINESRSDGTWSDIYGCSGTWKATKN